MKIEYWPLDKILPYKNNSKLHNDPAIQASIRDFKPDQPIVVDRQGIIIKGHGRLAAAKALGLKEFPVIVREDLTPQQVKAARIADNSCNKNEWDLNLLKLDLIDIPEIEMGKYGLEKPATTNTHHLSDITISRPPEMTWYLIGIPTISLDEISADIDKISLNPAAIVESCVTDKT